MAAGRNPPQPISATDYLQRQSKPMRNESEHAAIRDPVNRVRSEASGLSSLDERVGLLRLQLSETDGSQVLLAFVWN